MYLFITTIQRLTFDVCLYLSYFKRCSIDYISDFGKFHGSPIQIQSCQTREIEFTISEPVGPRIFQRRRPTFFIRNQGEEWCDRN